MTTRARYPDDHRERCPMCLAYEEWKSSIYANDAIPFADRPSAAFLHAQRVEAYFAERADAGARDAQTHSERRD